MNTALSQQRIALIGGAGFIGHNLALELRRLGAEPHVIDGLQVNNLGAFSNASGDPNKQLYLQIIHDRLSAMRDAGIPLHVVDARDYHTLSRTLEALQQPVLVQHAPIRNAKVFKKASIDQF